MNEWMCSIVEAELCKINIEYRSFQETEPEFQNAQEQHLLCFIQRFSELMLISVIEVIKVVRTLFYFIDTHLPVHR